MRTVILTPYRGSGQRAENWRFVRRWITDNYDFPVVVADSSGEVFSPAEARNNAATMAGNWDVAVFHDSDTIAHPDAVEQAIQQAAQMMKMVVAGDSHMYCCPASSKRIMDSRIAEFARPDTFDKHGIYEKPCSGVFAVNRDLFDKVGGYVESLKGWGFEDLVFLQMCGIFGDGNTWIPGHITLHMWHPPTPRTHNTQTNEQVWRTLTRYRQRNDRDGARQYLKGIGHTVP